MSFKGASESTAMQRQVRRVSDEGVKPAPWAVVTFRPGQTNRGKPCVYRRCFPFRDGAKARNRYLAECRNVPAALTYVALVTLVTLGNARAGGRQTGERMGRRGA